MSRVGKTLLEISDKVKVTLDNSNLSVVCGQNTLSMDIDPSISVQIEDKFIKVSTKKDDKHTRSMWGLTNRLIGNMLKGVEDGFTKELELSGTGFKAAVKGDMLVVNAGFSHAIRVVIPSTLKVECPKPTEIIIKGASKADVNQLAAHIRAIRKPEPYKGKGIKYKEERILRKVGKKK